jgi:hypothetical protein
VPCGDEAAFLAAAQRVADDAGLRARFGRAARAAVAGLKLVSVSRNIYDLLRDLAQRKAA